MPSIPVQQVLITEVRDEKLGISSQCSPQEHSMFLGRDVRGAQPLLQRADGSRARSFLVRFRPTPEADPCRGFIVATGRPG